MDASYRVKKRGEKELTVGANDGGAPRYSHHTMNKDFSTAAEGCLDEATRVGKVDKEIVIL